MSSATTDQMIRGSSQFAQMFLLTICVAGLQFTWGVEQSYVNVYLLSLGMSKAVLSIVWIAGPISGLIMQPVIGVLSDTSTSKYGRRRPYMVVGSLLVTGGLVTMAWAREIVEAVMFWNNKESVAAAAAAASPAENETQKLLVLLVATMAIFVTDFAINAVQACCRAIIVDSLPIQDQELANGWAGRMIAIGHLLGYFLGTLNLVALFGGFFGNTQLKSMCVISSLALMVCVGITSYSVREKVLTKTESMSDIYGDSVVNNAFRSLKNIFPTLSRAITTLPPQIATIFKVQLCAWYGWFGFLFYVSTWVGEVYMKYGALTISQDSPDKVGDIARKGSASLLAFSSVSLFFSLVLPALLKGPLKTSTTSSLSGSTSCTPSTWLKWILPTGVLLKHISLTDLWFVSHLVYAFAMFCTGFVNSVMQATLLVGLCGFSWALTTWAPFALLAEEIWRMSEDIEQGRREGRRRVDVNASNNSEPEPADYDEQEEATRELLGRQQHYGSDDNEEKSADMSGVYLGIHNVAVTVPQLVATFMSFLIYSFIDDSNSQGQDGGRAIAYTLQLGSVSALAAAYFCTQLKRKH